MYGCLYPSDKHIGYYNIVYHTCILLVIYALNMADMYRPLFAIHPLHEARAVDSRTITRLRGSFGSLIERTFNNWKVWRKKRLIRLIDYTYRLWLAFVSNPLNSIGSFSQIEKPWFHSALEEPRPQYKWAWITPPGNSPTRSVYLGWRTILLMSSRYSSSKPPRIKVL